MTMRRNDFKALAAIIRKRKVQMDSEDPYNIYYIRELVDDLVVYFKESNPSFDKSKFMKACGWYNE